MIKNIYVLKLLLIFVSFTVFSFGNMTVFMLLGLVVLLGGCFLAFRQGMAMGHEACSISSSLKHIAETGDRQPDPLMLRQAYSLSGGVKSIFAGAIVDYAINCAYIIFMLLHVNDTLMIAGRLASFVMLIPYWPVLTHWHEVYNILSWDIVALLMVSPFILPLCQFLGYRQGPELWAKTEKAMAEGKRRAKARSRIGKKKAKTPKSMRPEI